MSYNGLHHMQTVSGINPQNLGIDRNYRNSVSLIRKIFSVTFNFGDSGR